MKWVKASERLPENKNNICIRWGSAEEWVYSSARPFKALEKLMLITPELEWLDESDQEDQGERIKELESKVNELTMDNMTHEYNQAEAERFRPEYERQLAEGLIDQLKKEAESWIPKELSGDQHIKAVTIIENFFNAQREKYK